MFPPQALDDVGADGIACLCFLAGWQFKLSKEDITKLPVGIDVELVPDRSINFFFQGTNLFAKFLVQLGKKFGVKGYPVQLHL